MSIFKKTTPPPAPKKQLPGWFGIITPVIMAIILGLSGIVYNSIAGELKDLKSDKADKQYTYEKIEANQQILKENQVTLKEALESITKMQIETEKEKELEKERLELERQKAALREQRLQQSNVLSPPLNFKMFDNGVQPRAETVEPCTKPALSPKEFKQYLQLNKEERAAFRKLHPSYATLPE
jgi:septal ring factor EnvC (AmiA/AmiB activator)